ncbi:MAG TPA: PAS domain-containing protein, partial [Elainellaceae cyanobacterium]
MPSELHSDMVLNNSTLLEFVTRIAQQIQQTRSLSAILQTVAVDVCHVLNLKQVNIHQFQENGTCTTLAEAIAPNPIAVQRSQVDCKLAAHDDVHHDSLDSKISHTLIASELNSPIIESPIISEHTSWGLITAHPDDELSSDEYVSTQRLLEYVAVQVAIAIQQDKARQQCRNQQSRFQQLAAALPGVFCQCLQQSDGSIHLQTINPDSLETLGFSPEDSHLTLETWLDSIYPDDRPALDHALQQAAQQVQPWSWQGRIQGLSGDLRWLHVIANPDLQRDGKTHWYALIINVTEAQQNIVKTQQTQQVLHHAMEAWGNSEAKYQALVEGNPAVTYIAAIDEVFSTLYISPQIEDMLGYSYSDWQTNAGLWCKCIHHDDRDRVLAELTAQIDSANAYIQEYRMITLAGERIWIQDHAVIMSAQDGQSQFIQGTMLDITKRKTLEDTLRLQANQERLMSSMIQRIRQSLQLHDILQMAVEEVQRFLGTDRVVIFKFEPNHEAIAITESVQHPTQSVK